MQPNGTKLYELDRVTKKVMFYLYNVASRRYSKLYSSVHYDFECVISVRNDFECVISVSILYTVFILVVWT